MPTELTLLAWSAALLLALIVIQATVSALAHGPAWALGNRDVAPPVGVFEGRAKRTVDNMIEGLSIFAPLVLVAAVAGVSTPESQLGAQLFFFGRVAYAACYLIGIPYVRTLVWTVSTAGSVLILFALFGTANP